MKKLLWRSSVAFGIAGLGLGGMVFAAEEPVPATPAQENQNSVVVDHDQSARADSEHAGGLLNKQFSVRRLSQLTSGDIKNDKGEDLGRINSIVVDTGREQIAYAILSFGGFLGAGDKEFAVPWSALQKKIYPDKFDKISYTLNVDKNRLKEAKSFEKDKWPNIGDTAWARDVHQFWGQRPYWEADRSTEVTVRSDRHGVDVDTQHNSPTIQGTPISPNDRTGRMYPGLVRADRLVGHRVLDSSGKDFANLTDVMVDADSGRLVYGIVQIHKSPDLAKDFLNPIPMSLIQVQPVNMPADTNQNTEKNATDRVENTTFLADKDAFKVVFTGTMDQLNNGPKFPEREWPMMDQNWGKQVYSHYSITPLWERNRDSSSIDGNNSPDGQKDRDNLQNNNSDTSKEKSESR